ncbi:MAG TPA: ABC transporter ATP-binding protein [Candidatus Limnocylindrales bacterium]|jgi:peptide/nickel transport system ATP-binding protein
MTTIDQVADRGTAAGPGPTPLIEVRNLRVQLPSRDGIVTAIDGIDFSIGRGEIVALVGESGSGKSMTALSIARLLPPTARITSGEVLLDGVDLLELPDRDMDRIRGARIAMLFQQPKASLDPTSRVGDQVGEALRFGRGASPSQAWQKSVALLEDVGIPEARRRARAYAHQLSGGMAQRVMTAAAISGGPELLIADEPTTALDVTVQAQILGLLKSMVREHGLSMLLISHDLGIVSTIADRVVVLYAGKVVEDGPTAQIIGQPTHPYTEALMRSSLLIPNDEGRLYAIPGGAPRPGEELVGCRFRARCQYADTLGIAAKCETLEPGLHLCESGHQCRCWAVQDGLITLTPADPIRLMITERTR